MTRRPSSFTAVLALTLGTAAVAACLCATGLAAWADGLPDGALARAASDAAHGLDDAMKAVGADRPVAALHRLAQRAQQARLPGAGPR